MSVDPIDKAGAARALLATEATQPLAAAKGAAPTEAASAVARVRSGEVSLAEYVDAHVAAATHHLEGKLGPEVLEQVREQLRAELVADPTALQLLREASGLAVPPQEP